MNTTTKGDAFRDEVAGLLRASGVEVETERLKGHKRGDLFFETRQFGTLKRYAVEAKSWERALNHGDLERIYGGYVSLIQNARLTNC